MAGALNGVRVLDLADESGAYCGKLLADMGADVIMIEPPGGARMRAIEPLTAAINASAADANNRSLFFWHYSTNKRSVTLDLQVAADRDRFLRLVSTADLVLETFAPGYLESLGLGSQALTATNPRVTLVSITPFGQTGPYRDYRGSDLICQALGGMVFVNGFPDEPPLQGLGLQAYHSASTYAAIGALLALLARERLAHGQWVDVSIQQCVAAAVEHASSFFHQHGIIPERQGSLHWTRYFRVGGCRDGYVLHCTLGDWTSLIEWVKADGKAHELGDAAWEDVAYRRDHCVRLFDVLDQWAQEQTVAELVDGAQLRRLPYAAVVPPESLRLNAQLIERGFFVPVHHEKSVATVIYPGAPYRFSATPWSIRRRAPSFGEHTEEAFADVQAARTQRLDQASLAAPDSRRATPNGRSLEGIRIIDFTWVVAGPVATRILADHGAEVIKIERRDALDFGSRRGGLTGNLNRGKQSVVINMNTAAGIDLARRLVVTADVVIDNFSARVMRNWGLDYDHLRNLKADIIAVSMSGFGHTGPQRDYVSYGPTLQALAGYTLLMRHPGQRPAGWGFSYSDMAAGCSGALAVLLALWHRRRTGEGQHIDLSQLENVTALLGPRLLEILSTPNVLTLPAGNASQEAASAPHGVYRCADLPGSGPARDRWCAVAVFSDDDWERFCRVIGRPAWTRDERCATRAARLAHQSALNPLVESWTMTRSAEAVMHALQSAGVAAGVVANAEDLCRRDPQLEARRYWAQVPTPEGATVTLDGVPFTMSETPGRVSAPGALLGEHTESVLERVLGMDATAIRALRAANVIA